VLWSCVFAGVCARAAFAKETFSVDYIVSISQRQPAVARVRWELAGIEEVKHLTLHFPAGRFDHFGGSGTLEPIEGGIRWVPGGPYAHLTYRAQINHARGQHGRYDSYAGRDWVVTRARDLFPRIGIEYAARDGARPKSRARLIFRVPSGWQTATVFAASAPNTYRLSQPDMTLDRPHGWFAMGTLTRDRQEIADIMIEVARAPGSALATRDLFALFGSTLPALRTLLAAEPQTVLVVSAPDPMWHGGISGERSFFMHAQRPLRTPDKTSPYLHEMFHVLQPYRPAADADWIEEGLAEFYSLELQRRAGLIDAAAFARALGYFERFGLWNVDLTQQKDNAATGNSAPLIMYALDQRIQHATAGKKRLDDVVHRLVLEHSEVDTSHFLHAVDSVSGKHFAKFFDRHVRHGTPPRFTSAP
jgi:hypothetical protein